MNDERAERFLLAVEKVSVIVNHITFACAAFVIFAAAHVVYLATRL